MFNNLTDYTIYDMIRSSVFKDVLYRISRYVMHGAYAIIYEIMDRRSRNLC
jgi:hypothetical protein